jgi:predicted acyltransferase
MRNLFIYYIAIVAPLAALIIFAKQGQISNELFVLGFFMYVFVYRKLTDIWRLRSKGILKKITLQDILTPFLQTKYFRALYLP